MSEMKNTTIQTDKGKIPILKPKKFRVHAIDNLRGLMIIYIILIHAVGAFLAKPDNWIYGVQWAIGDAIAAPAFTFVSGISLSLSYFAELEKMGKSSDYTAWHARIKFLVRTLWLGYIALFTAILNTIFTSSNRFFLWEIMQTLFFARLFGYLFLKYSPKIKLGIGLIFFIFSEPLHMILEGT